jgi:hypothetical protein
MHVTQRHPDAADSSVTGADPDAPAAAPVTVPAGPGGGHAPDSAPSARNITPASAPAPAQPGADSTCTVSQLRRFIKSRPYVPMHELRRRFELNGDADEVCGLATPDGVVYLGLPRHETELIGELLRQGEIGLELCSDPRAPIVVGVYAMRPVARA